MLIENIQSLFMGLGGGLLPYIYKIYIDNKTINIKSEETRFQMNHQLNVNLINRRLNSYGDLYILLSDFIKKTNCLGSFYPTEISNSEISEFLSKFKEKDSELSLIFSSYTGKVMRIFQNVLIHLMKDQNNQTPCNIKKAGMVARELEKAMRSDIGIYGMKYDGGEIKPEEPIKIPPELQELLNNEKEDW